MYPDKRIDLSESSQRQDVFLGSSTTASLEEFPSGHKIIVAQQQHTSSTPPGRVRTKTARAEEFEAPPRCSESRPAPATSQNRREGERDSTLAKPDGPCNLLTSRTESDRRHMLLREALANPPGPRRTQLSPTDTDNPLGQPAHSAAERVKSLTGVPTLKSDHLAVDRGRLEPPAAGTLYAALALGRFELPSVRIPPVEGPMSRAVHRLSTRSRANAPSKAGNLCFPSAEKNSSPSQKLSGCGLQGFSGPLRGW